MIAILLFIISNLIAGSNNNKQLNNSNRINPTGSLIYHSRCDSLYEFDFNKLRNSRDTIINGINYALTIQVYDNHILAFREFNQKYSSYKYMELVINGEALKLYDEENEFIEDIHYEPGPLSPENKYIIIYVYYLTMDINDEEKIILKFSHGEILDLEKGKILYNLYGNDVNGLWNYCSQFISDDVILFDPEKNTEDEE